MSKEYTVIGFFRGNDCASWRVVTAENAGKAALKVQNDHSGTDYVMIGVLDGTPRVLGGFETLPLENMQSLAELADRKPMTVIGYDLAVPLKEQSPWADALLAKSWPHAMLVIMGMKSRAYQPVCVVEGTVAFLLTQSDIETMEACANA